MRRKKLSLHVNRKVEAVPVPSLERPLVHPLAEEGNPPSGLREIKVRDSQGARIGSLQVSAADLDDELIEDLRAWQSRHAHDVPIPKLVVKS